MDQIEAVVLGAGPAGSAAAITIAAAGLNVVVIEREQFPRAAPGESLHPGVQPLLQKLGVEERILAERFLRHPGCVLRWGHPEQFQAFGEDADGPWLGFQAWRPIFDQILLDRARSLGARVLQPHQVRGPVVAGELTGGLDSTAGVVRAGTVVDATGRWRAVSRWLSLSWTRRGPPRQVWYGYATGEKHTGREEIPALTGDSTGWTWVARVTERTYQWTRMNFDHSRPADGWLPDELSELTPAGPTCGADATWQIADAPAGHGYYLVGDAAAVLDPASSHGVLKALMSGMYAGHMIVQQRLGRIHPAAAAEHYKLWLRDWFDRDATRLDAFYEALGVTPFN